VKKILLSLTLLLFFAFCQTNEKEHDTISEDTVDLNSYQEVKLHSDNDQVANTSEEIVPDTANLGDSDMNREIMTENKSSKIVVSFLKWYKKNHSKIHSIELVNNVHWDRENDSTELYSVNFDGTEKYLLTLKSSGFISDLYLNKWREYFKEKEEEFKKYPQFDGPPDGFQFDFVLWTQIVDETLHMIDYYKFIEVFESDMKANVKIDIMMKLNFSLSKQKEIWLIDDIENLGM